MTDSQTPPALTVTDATGRPTPPVGDSATPGPSLAVARWGTGPLAVLVHGGGAGGEAAFSRQRPLAETYTLVLPDRPGSGRTPADGRQDAARDAHLLVEQVLTDGAHLVGHSYGAVATMVAAALRPDRVRSLVLIEPPVFHLARHVPVVVQYWRQLQDAIDDPDPRQRVRRFFDSAGIPAPVPVDLPPPLRHLAAGLQTMRQPWDIPLDLPTMRRLDVPKVVVSGAHRDAFEQLADHLARLIHAERAVLPGAAHAAQDTGEPFNSLLHQTWSHPHPHR